MVNVRKFVVGEKVMAKWPNTSLYFNGEVVDYNDIQYLIRFDDDDRSEFPLKFGEVITPFDRRSRSRSRGRTPTRGRSPGRKPSKSPGRKTPTSNSPYPRIKSEKTEITETKTNSVTLRARQPGTRQSARIANSSEKKPDIVPVLKVDTEEIIKQVSLMQTWKSRLMRVIYATWATVVPLPLMALYLIMPFIIIQMCTKNKCYLTTPTVSNRLKNYYDPRALMIVGGFFLCQLLISLIPLGKVIKLKNGVNYRCNGYIALLATIGVPIIMVGLEYDLSSWYLLYRQLLTSGIALCLILGVLLYVKSFYSKKAKINPAGNSGYIVPDMLEGREYTPALGRIDAKLLLVRCGIMLVILLEAIILLRNLKNSQGSQYSISLMIVTVMHVFYCADFIWFEESIISTYEYSNTGMGLLKLVEWCTLPYYFSFFPRFLLNHGKELPWYCLVGITALFLVGYVITRGANSEKHAFKSNPADPALVHLESLPTAAGTRILVSGWWGLVRHPNYLGDIILQLAVTLLCGFEYALPWIVYGLSVLTLLTRIIIVENECNKNYGLGWSSYISRVKYRLIPKIL